MYVCVCADIAALQEFGRWDCGVVNGWCRKHVSKIGKERVGGTMSCDGIIDCRLLRFCPCIQQNQINHISRRATHREIS